MVGLKTLQAVCNVDNGYAFGQQLVIRENYNGTCISYILNKKGEDGCSEAGSELLLISRYLLQTGSYCWILVRYLVKGKRQWEKWGFATYTQNILTAIMVGYQGGPIF